MDILKIENLTKIYGATDTKVTALDYINLTITEGEFVAVVGPSGSGKSTLLHIMGGIDKPTEGNVTIAGKDITAMSENESAIFRRRNIGLVYQFYNLIPTLTVAENIMLPHLLDNREGDEVKLKSIIETIGLSDRAKHLPSELSGGQQQRVSIGRALINDPAVILADEPTGNLDSKASGEIIDLLKIANKQYGRTLIIITHDEKIAMQSDRVITISDGRIQNDEVSRA